MIGTLLFYVLHPLSRYLFNRPSEASKKDSPPAVVNGTAVWDGGGVTTKRFTKSQTTLLDPSLSPSCGTKGKTKERMKEPGTANEDNMTPHTDNEQLMVVLHEETKSDAGSKMTEVQLAVKNKEAITNNEIQQDKVEGPKQEDGEKIHPDVFHLKQNTDDACVCPAEDTKPELGLRAQLQCLQVKDNTTEITYVVQKKTKTPSTEESVAVSEPSTLETTSLVQEQIQTPIVTSAKATSEVTECWDEYDEMHDGGSSEVIPASLFSNTQNRFKLSTDHDTQTSWHFPAGPGLEKEVQCPLWQFPTMSYYPPINPTEPLEVMWRVWEERDESASAAEPALMPVPFRKASMDFTVMSYNILAEELLEAHQDLYTHCPLEVLDWSYRYNLILEEILKWAPDILCLQEVQENHYHEQLCPALSRMGYKCVYKRRTGTKTDGCATCYRSSFFSEISVAPLEFFRPETELLDRHNVGIVLLLRPVIMRGSDIKATGPPLCVANTHLLFNPRRGEVKLAQLAIMLAEIDRVVQSCKAKGENCNLILCGDFNSVPHMSLYQLITTGELHFQGLPAWMVSGQEDLSHKTHCCRLFAPLWPSCLGITDNCQYKTVMDTFESHSQTPGKYRYSHESLLQLRFCPATIVRPPDLELIPGVTDNTPDASRETCDKSRFRNTIRHRLDLESVYKHILPGSGSPEVTTLHSEVGATVDYIFYTPRRVLTAHQRTGADCVREGLKLIGSVSLLSEEVLWSMRGLPNDIFPSDHLSLVAKFQLELNAA